MSELWFVDFGEPYPAEPAWHRPTVVLGPPDTFGVDFPFVIVAPVTTTRRGLSVHVEVEPTVENGLEATSYIQCELVRSVNRRRLVHRLGTIDATTKAAVDEIVQTLLGY